jgi:hypothetical protein
LLHVCNKEVIHGVRFLIAMSTATLACVMSHFLTVEALDMALVFLLTTIIAA